MSALLAKRCVAFLNLQSRPDHSPAFSRTPVFIARYSSLFLQPTEHLNQSFERLYNLKVHLRKHTGETPYDCPVDNCARQFKWRSSMAHHVRSHHHPSELSNIQFPMSSLSPTHVSKAAVAKRRVKVNVEMCTTAPSPTAGIKKSAKKNRRKISKSLERPLANSCIPASTPQHFEHPQVKLEPQEEQDQRLQCPAQPMCDLSVLPDVIVGPSEQEPPLFLDVVDLVSGEHILELDGEGLSMLQTFSDMMSRETSVEVEVSTTSPQSLVAPNMHQGVSDQCMSFLATSSEDATDAEMESLAHYDRQVSPELAPKMALPETGAFILS